MESALRRLPPLRAGVQAGLVASLLVAAAAGWALTGDRMTGMDAGPGTELGELGWFVGIWVTMMVAMMLPPLTPVVVTRARIQAQDRDQQGATPSGATGLFVAGYLTVWVVAGLIAYAVVEGIRALGLGFLAWDEAGPYVAGGVILAAAAYQLTRLKSTSLEHCRDPLSSLTEHWRPGRAGGLRMGLDHGGFCVGSSWMLMAALFALGLMSVGWMVAVAALIAAEKLLPWTVRHAVAVVLVALGVAVAVAPGAVPGLTIPGSMETMAP